MKQIYRYIATVILVALFLSAVSLYNQYRALRHTSLQYRNLVQRNKPTHIPEAFRVFTKLSNYTSDIVFKPTLKNSRRYRLLIVSLSAGSYYKRRSAVRNTWHKRLKEWNANYAIKVIHYFVCFTPKRMVVNDDLMTEANQYNDIIIFSERDRYSALPMQTITALDFMNSYFDFDFILKTDDDSLVNIDSIMNKLEELDQFSFGGRVYKHRTPGNEQQKAWLHKYHPDSGEYTEFAPGAGYLIGSEIIGPILTHTNSVELTDAEDVYMGEVIRQLGIPINVLSGIYPIWQEFCTKSSLKNPYWVLIHWLDPSRMVRFWERLESNIGGCHKGDMSRAKQQAKAGAFSRN